MFQHVLAYAGDPIFSLNETFQKDPREGKVNLSIGIYFDGEGKLPVMNSVRKAQGRLAIEGGPTPYLPIAGIADYRAGVQRLVFGSESSALVEGRVATLQSLGGSGALKVGADFLKRYYPDSSVWISDPSWENHRVVFEGAGFRVNSYPYYDGASGGLRFDDMLAELRVLPPHSIVLLHACCHNPTGVDLTAEQWLAIIAVLEDRDLIPFVDMAYQGFGQSLDADAFGVRAMADAGVTFLVANSFSKNFSLYGERVGGLSVVCRTRDEADRVLGQLASTVRANYSNPPTHGATIVSRILNDAELRSEWEIELGVMRDRILAMRRSMFDGLEGQVDPAMRQRYVEQHGMFTYTGLTAEQADILKKQYGVYVLRSGRMCVAGLNERNVDAVVAAIAAVVKPKK
ncbi:aspartate/tyrosine/aromatic aminotransferase [Paraburkholderia terrae]|uniref:amino acid aminotransferase n=1 Tax=Paraburkholderia terrae TaxID=311230 RepID=UPI0030E113FC